MKPSFRITINSEEVATIGIENPGVCSCVVHSHTKMKSDPGTETSIELSLGGLDRKTNEFLDWPKRELTIGDKILVEIVENTASHPNPERRPVATLQDLENKKACARQAANELGWQIIESSEDCGR